MSVYCVRGCEQLKNIAPEVVSHSKYMESKTLALPNRSIKNLGLVLGLVASAGKILKRQDKYQ